MFPGLRWTQGLPPLNLWTLWRLQGGKGSREGAKPHSGLALSGESQDTQKRELWDPSHRDVHTGDGGQSAALADWTASGPSAGQRLQGPRAACVASARFCFLSRELIRFCPKHHTEADSGYLNIWLVISGWTTLSTPWFSGGDVAGMRSPRSSCPSPPYFLPILLYSLVLLTTTTRPLGANLSPFIFSHSLPAKYVLIFKEVSSSFEILAWRGSICPFLITRLSFLLGCVWGDSPTLFSFCLLKKKKFTHLPFQIKKKKARAREKSRDRERERIWHYCII